MQKRKKIVAVALAAMLMAGMFTIPAVADSSEGTETHPVTQGDSTDSSEPGESFEESSTPSGEISAESSVPSGESPAESSAPSGESPAESSAPLDESPAESSAASGESSAESSAAPDESFALEAAVFKAAAVQTDNTGITITGNNGSQSYDHLASAVAALTDGDTLTLSNGTYTATAHEQLRIAADNVTIQGAGSGSTTIDCGGYSVSGQAGILAAGDNIAIKDLKVVSTGGAGISAVKYTTVESGSVSGGSIENVAISSSGHGLNLHGTSGITVDNLVVESAGKANIALAASTGVTIRNTTTSSAGWKADIGLMYAENSAYATPCTVTLGSGNRFANHLIYSERPSSAPGGADGVSGCENAGLSVVASDDGTWATVTADTAASLPYIASSGIRYPTIQKAVNAAKDGDTVKIPAGTYQENITADKAITLEGAGQAETTLKFQPEGRQSYTFLGSRPAYPVIYASSNLTLRNLAVSGPTAEHHGIDGIFATAGLTVENVSLQDIRCTADGGDICGVQYGRPILVEGSGNVQVSGCSIARFQKQAMDLNTSGTVEIRDTVITGYGPQQTIAQNGIVIRKGTASVTGCTLSGMSYTADNEDQYASAAIIAFGGAQVQVNGTTVSGVDMALDAEDSGTAVTGSNNTFLSPVHNIDAGSGYSSVNLTECYWGDTPDFTRLISGTVSYMPYYTDAQMTTLAADIGGITISNTSLEAAKGDRIFLNAEVTPGNAYDKTVVWASSNEQVATVAGGIVTVLAEEGTTTITAKTANNKSVYCEITVRKTAEKPITVPGTDGEKILEVHPSVDSGNVIDSGLITSAVNAASKDEVIVVAVPKESSENAVIEGSALQEAAEKAQNNGARTLAITTTDKRGMKSVVTIDLAGIQDLSAIGDINIGATNDVEKDLIERVAENLPENAAVLFINLTHNGKFPFPVTRSDYVGDQYKAGGSVYLYWVDPEGKLSERQALTVDAEGYITYTIRHASPYVVTDTEVKQEKIKVDIPKLISAEYPYTGSEIQAQFEPYDTSVIECDNPGGTEVGSYVTVFRLKDKSRYEWNTETNKDGEWQYTWQITAVTADPTDSPKPTVTPNPSVSPEPAANPTATPAATPAPSAGPKTGDSGNNALPIALAVIAAIGMLSFTAVKAYKKPR